MNRNKKVSIIIPIYNLEEYIERCIKSILKQTYQNIEIILVNDGSKDNSSNICEIFRKKDSRIKVIHQENMGVSAARNNGIINCTGEYITFVDGDDWVLENYIETLVDILETNNAQLAIIDYYKVNKNGVISSSAIEEKVINFTFKEALDEIHNPNLYEGYPWNKLFIREIIIKNDIFFDINIKLSEDLLFCCQYIEKIKTVSYKKVPLYMYVMRENSATNSLKMRSECSRLLVYRKLYEIAYKLDKKSKFTQESEKNYLNCLVSTYYYAKGQNELAPTYKELKENIKGNFNKLKWKQKVAYLGIKYKFIRMN